MTFDRHPVELLRPGTRTQYLTPFDEKLRLLGALGVYWEVHAPGMVLPGLLGRSFPRLTPPQRCHVGELALFDCKKPSSNLI